MATRQWYDPVVLTDLYLEKAQTILQIAKYFDVGYKAVRSALIRERVPLRPRGIRPGTYKHSPETRSRLRQQKLGINNPNHTQNLTPSRRRQITKHLDKWHRWRIGRKHRPDTLQKMSNTRVTLGLSRGGKNPMSNPATVKRWVKANHLKPNSKELLLQFILDERLPGAYRLNVSQGNTVGNKVPDFVSTKGKRIIELWGDYWHRGEDPKRLRSYYVNLGYDALVVWEHELNRPKVVASRVVRFHEKGAVAKCVMLKL